MITAAEILDFWFSPQVIELWFTKSADFDEQLRTKFLTTYEDAKSQHGSIYSETPAGIIAQVIIFDQFPRNMFRDTPQAFATDALALNLATQAITQRIDKQIPIIQRRALYMPFMHSEDLSQQEKSVKLFAALNNKTSLDYAIQHKTIIERFGRYPHRNKILGRISTAAEKEFLSQPNSSF